MSSTVVITGGTGGIGYQSASRLAAAGYDVIVTGRDADSGRRALAQLSQVASGGGGVGGGGRVDLVLGDLSTRAGVAQVAAGVAQLTDRVDVLVNNAGYVGRRPVSTEDGLETAFAVNVMAPHLLTEQLMPLLRAGALRRGAAARVVTVTGGLLPNQLDVATVQRLATAQPERSHPEPEYVGMKVYSQTKLVMMAAMRELAARLDPAQVTVNICYPGRASTAMARTVTNEMVAPWMRPFMPVFRLVSRPDGGWSAGRAARSSVALAVSQRFEGRTDLFVNARGKVVQWPAPLHDPALRAAVWDLVRQASRC